MIRTMTFALLTGALLALASSVSAQEPDHSAEESLPLATLSVMQDELAQTSRQLLLLESHIRFDADRHATLDVEGARSAGFSEDILQLAQEMIDVQNEYLTDLREGVTGEKADLDLAGHEALADFLALATDVDTATGRGFLVLPKAGSTNACGTFDNPVPTTAGSWTTLDTYRSRTDAVRILTKLEFHATASYVGTSDYTRGRSYRSRWGTCSSPRFRDHGAIRSSSSRYEVRIQYGECNPEVFSYSWPYWNWPSYCRWWHSKN